MFDMFKRYVTPIGLVAATLVLLFLVAFWFAAASTSRHVEQGIRQNFAAVALLASLQVQAEQMRRFEKEMFIYVGDAGPRAKYVSDFQRAYSILLATLDSMQASGSENFDEADRVEMASWKDAALFYGTEFTKLAQRATSLDGDKADAAQRAQRTADFNAAIGPGIERFSELIDGARRMRLRKETGAQQVPHDVAAALERLRLGTVLGGLVLGAALLALLRPRSGSATGPGTT